MLPSCEESKELLVPNPVRLEAKSVPDKPPKLGKPGIPKPKSEVPKPPNEPKDDEENGDVSDGVSELELVPSPKDCKKAAVGSDVVAPAVMLGEVKLPRSKVGAGDEKPGKLCRPAAGDACVLDIA